MLSLLLLKKAFDWATWDETSEVTLADDNIFVCLMENVNNGGDETGQGGGLSSPNTVLTESGTLAGATGSPPTRDFDGTDDALTMTTSAVDALLGNNTWTIIVKVTNLDLVTNDTFFSFWDAASENGINCYITSTDTIFFSAEDGNVNEGEQTTDSLAAATTYYIAMWSDGSVLRAGFSTTKPTKWSDFDAGKREEWSTIVGSFDGVTFEAAQKIADNTGGTGELGGEIYYVVMAKTCLIDNSA